MIMIEVEKFLEFQLGKRISDRDKTHRKLLKGYFKEKDSDNIISEEFLAYELQKCSVKEVYECYLAYFNYTLIGGEKPRIAVSAKWITEFREAKKNE